jgi:hypothetical protein
MTFDPAKIIESKRAFRRRLTARPIEEKLAMLDALRERTLVLRATRPGATETALREEPLSYRVHGKKGG